MKFFYCASSRRIRKNQNLICGENLEEISNVKIELRFGIKLEKGIRFIKLNSKKTFFQLNHDCKIFLQKKKGSRYLPKKQKVMTVLNNIFYKTARDVKDKSQKLICAR